MLKNCTYIIAFLLCLHTAGQAAAADFHAWIYFVDKPQVAASLATPSSILTQRAINRKLRHAIPIDVRDVPLNQQYVNQLKNTAGITYLAQSKWFNCVLVKGQPTAIDALASLSFVASIDYADPTKSSVQQAWSKFAQNTTAPLAYGAATNQIAMLGIDQLHNTGNTGAGMIIAVTDSGFPQVASNSGFAQLRAQHGILGGYDFVARNGSYLDDHFHGSNVLSILAGAEPGTFKGSAPDAQYYLFRTEVAATETPAELAYWVAAAERADSLGVDVINISLGYLGFDNPAENLTYSDMNGVTSFMSRGVNVAFEKGMVIVTSAGNSGNSTAHPYIASPADAPGAFTVGAVNAQQLRSSFSSTGPTADNRLKPDVVAQGSATAFITTAGSVSSGNGTSYSCPLIAGGIACLMQAFPNKTPQQILDAVRASASQSITPDNLLGYGVPNFGNAQQTLAISDTQTKPMHYFIQNDRLFVVAPGESITTIKLFNLHGQLVLQQALDQVESIDLSPIARGIYLFKADNKTQGFKIAK